ncbi:MAG: DUF1801 domain-containing protein [Pirellulales bacterium]
MKNSLSVDAYIASCTTWQNELVVLRKILLKCKLVETVKWGGPVYTYQEKNVVGIGAFKSYVGLWFFQGALLSDPEGLLINAQEGKTKAQRQMRFQSGKEIKAKLIAAYVTEAKALVDRGESIQPDRNRPLVLPAELQSAFQKHKRIAQAFDKLSLSCKREYVEYIDTAKKSETKARRLEKVLALIQDGLGLNDRYR